MSEKNYKPIVDNMYMSRNDSAEIIWELIGAKGGSLSRDNKNKGILLPNKILSDGSSAQYSNDVSSGTYEYIEGEGCYIKYSARVGGKIKEFKKKVSMADFLYKMQEKRNLEYEFELEMDESVFNEATNRNILSKDCPLYVHEWKIPVLTNSIEIDKGVYWSTEKQNMALNGIEFEINFKPFDYSSEVKTIRYRTEEGKNVINMNYENVNYFDFRRMVNIYRKMNMEDYKNVKLTDNHNFYKALHNKRGEYNYRCRLFARKNSEFEDEVSGDRLSLAEGRVPKNFYVSYIVDMSRHRAAHTLLNYFDRFNSVNTYKVQTPSVHINYETNASHNKKYVFGNFPNYPNVHISYESINDYENTGYEVAKDVYHIGYICVRAYSGRYGSTGNVYKTTYPREFMNPSGNYKNRLIDALFNLRGNFIGGADFDEERVRPFHHPIAKYYDSAIPDLTGDTKFRLKVRVPKYYGSLVHGDTPVSIFLTTTNINYKVYTVVDNHFESTDAKYKNIKTPARLTSSKSANLNKPGIGLPVTKEGILDMGGWIYKPATYLGGPVWKTRIATGSEFVRNEADNVNFNLNVAIAERQNGHTFYENKSSFVNTYGYESNVDHIPKAGFKSPYYSDRYRTLKVEHEHLNASYLTGGDT